MKLGMDDVLNVPHKSLYMLLFFCQIRLGADPGQGQKRSRGVPFFKKNFFRLEGYSNKPNA